jgi:hypothetical protein
VDSGGDPDTSKSATCETATPCTLRRAIVQARKLGEAERPHSLRHPPGSQRRL